MFLLFLVFNVSFKCLEYFYDSFFAFVCSVHSWAIRVETGRSFQLSAALTAHSQFDNLKWNTSGVRRTKQEWPADHFRKSPGILNWYKRSLFQSFGIQREHRNTTKTTKNPLTCFDERRMEKNNKSAHLKIIRILIAFLPNMSHIRLF